MAKIIVARDGQVLQEVELSRPRIVLGRHPGCDIMLEDRAVSAQHAAFISAAGSVVLEDLESTNGTYVNGRRVARHTLAEGDTIALARFQLRYVSGDATPARPPAIGRIEVLNGPNAGKVLVLSKPVSTLGRPGIQVVAITRQADAYFFQYLEGAQIPLIDGRPVGPERVALVDGTAIDSVGTQMVFRLGPAGA